MTEQDNIKFSKHKEVKGVGYTNYDNYDAIEVPFTDSIPSDFEGVMGVPISFLSKYNPDQFKIISITNNKTVPQELLVSGSDKYDRPYINGVRMYSRILIKHKQVTK
jgi:hypothetical protein